MSSGEFQSADAVVIGASDPVEMVEFLGAFGFVVDGTRIVTEAEASALFGLDHQTAETTLRSPGDTTTLAVVATPIAGVAPAGYDSGPRAMDLYVTDLDAASAAIEARIAPTGGTSVSPVAVIELGPVKMRQRMITGPDGLGIVLVESNMRRTSTLDEDAERMISGVHSVVWVVPDRDAEALWWQSEQGATKGMDLAFSEPAVSDYLGLVDRPVEIAMTMLADPEVSPCRLELLEFIGRARAPEPSRMLTGGLWALRFAAGIPTGSSNSPGGVRFQT